jgi:hypothetical protein
MFRLSSFAEIDIHFLERAEQPYEGPVEPIGATAARAEVGGSKLVRHTNNRSAHGAVFVRALSPGNGSVFVDPQSKSHCRYHIRYDPATIPTGGRSTGLRSGPSPYSPEGQTQTGSL